MSPGRALLNVFVLDDWIIALEPVPTRSKRVLRGRRCLQSQVDARFADEELARLSGGRRSQREMIGIKRGTVADRPKRLHDSALPDLD